MVQHLLATCATKSVTVSGLAKRLLENVLKMMNSTFINGNKKDASGVTVVTGHHIVTWPCDVSCDTDVTW